jgi:predicted dehydrogenase
MYAQNHRLRCIMVGLGDVSAQMLRHLDQQPWYTTVAAVDVRAEARSSATQTIGLPPQAIFADIAEALVYTQADLAIINTPSEWHYAQVRMALAAGVHVLVAKPFTQSLAHARELVELAFERGLTLCVGQQLRYNRHYTTVRRCIEAGMLGTVEAINFVNSKPRHTARNLAHMQQPALYEMSCHHFDILMSLLPDHTPEWIVCDGFQPSWSVYNGPCMVNALIRFSDRVHVLYQAGFSAQAPNYELRLDGTLGALRCRGTHMSVDDMVYEFAPRGQAFRPLPLDAEVSVQDAWVPFFAHWHAYLCGGEEPPFSGKNNLRPFGLLSAGIESVETDRPVDLKQHHYAALFS